MSDVEALVIGAGAAGLGAALELQARGREVLVLDAGDRPGGVMRSDRVEGFLVERGPSTTRMPAGAVALLQRAGLEAALVKASPESRARFLLRPEGLVPVPLGPLAFARTPLLSAAREAARCCASPSSRAATAPARAWRPSSSGGSDARCWSALSRPSWSASTPATSAPLGAEAVFPTPGRGRARRRLDRARPARAARSAAAAYAASRAPGRRARVSAGSRTLLARGLGERLRLGARVRALVPEAGGWRVELDERRAARARASCSQPTPRARRELLASLDAEAAAVRERAPGRAARDRGARARRWSDRPADRGLRLPRAARPRPRPARRALHEPALRGPRAGRAASS